jgi:hypothetical protein
MRSPEEADKEDGRAMTHKPSGPSHRYREPMGRCPRHLQSPKLASCARHDYVPTMSLSASTGSGNSDAQLPAMKPDTNARAAAPRNMESALVLAQRRSEPVTPYLWWAWRHALVDAGQVPIGGARTRRRVCGVFSIDPVYFSGQ